MGPPGSGSTDYHLVGVGEWIEALPEWAGGELAFLGALPWQCPGPWWPLAGPGGPFRPE